ncbi:hypothetical protein FQA47_007094 [Oryzias melastigma]|uniref:Uncharacterized protein n=1 Tax=Oryzias melastigma TaxID=30732 RepID=A0A834F340_ORYME|nr:hypothetical protein FQA47_007094 [Oryzias melastigma]
MKIKRFSPLSLEGSRSISGAPPCAALQEAECQSRRKPRTAEPASQPALIGRRTENQKSLQIHRWALRAVVGSRKEPNKR